MRAMNMGARSYTKTRRAEQEADTRRRIIEAALGLHTEVGPARTTISMIAERAGVQRHTVYAHFPDERALLMACSGLHIERDPPPTPEAWAWVNDPAVRLRQALAALYAWYERNEAITAAVLRDAERHDLLREIAELRLGTALAAIAGALSTSLGASGKAALTLAISFHTWRTLTGEAGLAPAAAVELMTRAVLGAENQRKKKGPPEGGPCNAQGRG